MAKLGSYFNNDVKVFLEQWGTEYDLDHSKAERDLGIKFIEPRKSIRDMTNDMIASGAIKEIK